jgi:hypothetical protein
MAEENILTVNLDTIVDSTLVVLSKDGSEKITPRSAVSYRQFISAVLHSDRLVETANILGISEDSLFKAISRYISKEIDIKPSNVSWKQFILNLSNYKQCQRCREILLLTNYSHDSSNWDGFAYACKACKAIQRKYFSESNPEYAHNHYINNKVDYLTNAGRYRAQLLLAQPKWANHEEIYKIYKDCPVGYHVDHIYPLQSDWVCGLHVEHNLRSIPARENLSKSNKYIANLHE